MAIKSHDDILHVVKVRLNLFSGQGILPVMRAMSYTLVALRLIQRYYKSLTSYTARWRENNILSNIYSEEIKRHIRYNRPQDGRPKRGIVSYRRNTLYNQFVLLNSVILRSKIKMGC
jgi:hypothetical protein